MATKLFTEEELITLKRNPYTYRVTTRMILYNVPISMDTLAHSSSLDYPSPC